MSRPDDNPRFPTQPALSDLLARFLHSRAEAQAAGLVSSETGGEVVLFEAAPVQTVDPCLAWNETLAVVRFYSPKVDASSWQAPPDWPTLVLSQEPVAAPAFALGNFPQLVRHVQPLLHTADLTTLRPTAGRPVPVPSLVTWATQQARQPQFPLALLTLGSLRLARQFDKADALLAKNRTQVPAAWQSAWANEEAALAWHRGEGEKALQMWQTQPESVPVLFNRGMALLFLGQLIEARQPLQRAVASLGEDSAWHHLGQLYLTLAQARGS